MPIKAYLSLKEIEFIYSIIYKIVPNYNDLKIQNRKNRSNSFGVEDHFLILTDQCLGEEYVVLEKVKLLEMRQLIYVRREIYPNFSNIEKKVEATGLAHVVGNIGGLAI